MRLPVSKKNNLLSDTHPPLKKLKFIKNKSLVSDYIYKIKEIYQR